MGCGGCHGPLSSLCTLSCAACSCLGELVRGGIWLLLLFVQCVFVYLFIVVGDFTYLIIVLRGLLWLLFLLLLMYFCFTLFCLLSFFLVLLFFLFSYGVDYHLQYNI